MSVNNVHPINQDELNWHLWKIEQAKLCINSARSCQKTCCAVIALNMLGGLIAAPIWAPLAVLPLVSVMPLGVIFKTNSYIKQRNADIRALSNMNLPQA